MASTQSSATLCSPNEDFGSPNQPFRMCVRNNFQRFVAQMEYSRPWKVLRKHIRKGWFGLPKSSFGRGKLAKLLQTIVASQKPTHRLECSAANKKVALSTSVSKQWFLHFNVRNSTLLVIFITFAWAFLPKSLLCCYRVFLSTLLCPFRASVETLTRKCNR
jgi:hypothetical protein